MSRTYNLQVGFNAAVSNTELISDITECLFSSSVKLKAQVTEVLAAVCVLSVQQGHGAVLAAFSDFRIRFQESFRFEQLLDSLKPHNAVSDSDAAQSSQIFDDENGIWEYRSAVMALINAITNSPEDLEERIMLRDEFCRRGLNEVMTVSRCSDIRELPNITLLPDSQVS